MYFARQNNNHLTSPKQSDKLLKFIYAIASGMDQTEAYLQHYSKHKCNRKTANNNASKLLMKPINRDLLDKAKQERQDAMKKELEKSTRVVAKEFTEQVLSVEQLDSFHSAVIQGLVNVEDHVPVYTVEEILDEDGNVIKRIRKPGLLPITRKPNVREKQVSVDALYKRFGSYAPVKSKFAGVVGNIGEDGEVENIKRFIIMGNGERMPLP